MTEEKSITIFSLAQNTKFILKFKDEAN